jgi:hypothetical protein
VSIQQHQQDTKTRHRVHSTQQPIHATIGTAPFQPNCATHTAILLLRPPKVHTPVTNHADRIQQQQHIATESCQSNNINKSRYASSSAFYTTTHTQYNRNCSISTQLRHSHSHLTPSTNKGHTPVPINDDKTQQQQHTATKPCQSNNINKIQKRVIECILHSNPYTLQSELHHFN